MSKTGSAAKVKLNSFDDLFGSSEMQTTGSEQIINAPLAELHDFKNHPFRVVDDEKMEETTESIRQYGVLVPGIARPRIDGGYRLLANMDKTVSDYLDENNNLDIQFLLDKTEKIIIEEERVKIQLPSFSKEIVVEKTQLVKDRYTDQQ